MQLGLDKVRDGIDVGGEDVALGAEHAAQSFVVLDDAVLHGGDATRYMRVGIALARRTMRGPARVSDAGWVIAAVFKLSRGFE